MNVFQTTFISMQRTTYRVILLNLAAIFATVVLASPFEKVYRQFEDGGFITYFSVIQLFMLSYFTCKIFKIRSNASIAPWRSPIAIWGIFSLGFSFLALDDLLMIHEWFDELIHEIWRIQETGLSDRIDDIIVGGYGLIAVALLVIYRRELKKYIVVMPTVVAAFVTLFLMVGVDILTNRDDILLMLFQQSTVYSIDSWSFVLEEGLKLLAEGFFIIAAHTCLKIAHRITAPISELETVKQLASKTIS